MDLIRNASEAVCQSVNVFMENIDKRSIPWVTLTSLVDHDGSLNTAARDSVVMTIYNITRESFASSYQPAPSANVGIDSANGLPVRNPPIYIDLYVMFMANFTNSSYAEGLAALSRVITYFQQTPFLTHQNTPRLAPEITQLTMELENLSPIDVNYVMGMLGTKYLPSVFYKMRMLPFASQAMVERTYPVTGPGAGVVQGSR